MPLNQFLFRVFGFFAHRNFGNSLLFSFRNKSSQDQHRFFSILGLDRNSALTKLNSTLNTIYGKNYDETNGMWSEHLLLFAALSESKYKIKTILEIGTFNGETARILGMLFPSASVETIDLPSSEIEVKSIYKYASKNLSKIRSHNLNNLENVNFTEKNSLLLLLEERKFDLIWIDGSHGYPIAAVDIANSVRLLTKNGIAICDDVYYKCKKPDRHYRSLASKEILVELEATELITLVMILKRIGFFFNFPTSNRKYLGVFQRHIYISTK